MYGADVMRLSACLLTIVAWNEFRTCPWSGYDTSHLSCTKDTHFHLGSCIDTEDRVQLQVVSAPSLFRLWLVTILCCLPNCPTSWWFMSHEVPEREERLAAQAAVLYYDVSNLYYHKWVLTSMENLSAAQVSSCTWWSLQPDCTSAVPPVPADRVLEKESWPTSLAAVSPWGSF